MNKPITPQQMSDWIKEEWKRKQDEAWDRLTLKLQDPKILTVFKRMKDR